MTLARVLGESPHAVQRELICEHFSFNGLGRESDEALSVNEFISFVLGADPYSALGVAVTEGWTKTDHLIANLQEQHAGLIKLAAWYVRPGVEEDLNEELNNEQDEDESVTKPPSVQQVSSAVAGGGSFDRFDTVEEFQARLASFHRGGGEEK